MRPASAYQGLLALDQMLFIPLQAEMTTELGFELKRKMSQRGLKPILIGYANGYLGYAVMPNEYENRSYEAWMSWYGPGFGAFLIDRIEELASLYQDAS